MEVGPRHPAAPPDFSDPLPGHHGVSGSDERTAQVEVAGDQPASVIEVERVAGQIEVGHHRDHTARRRAHREVLLQAELSAVDKASVVIVNPTHLATALRYDEDAGDAPEVLAQGQGELARRIVERAQAAGVPVVRDVPVARALQELEVGDQIPEALYEAVAEILREVWETERQGP